MNEIICLKMQNANLVNLSYCSILHIKVFKLLGHCQHTKEHTQFEEDTVEDSIQGSSDCGENVFPLDRSG